jgi:pimeloyl-ACP methyl ester carboxylesterase
VIPPPGQICEVDGHRFHIVCRGTGAPTVLLEAGIAASSLSWSLVQPGIAESTRCCAYDRAGLGWSEPPLVPRTFAGILDELGRILSGVSADEPAVLVGHSFGSLIVRGFAARHPERVAALVLVDPPMEWVNSTPERIRRLRRARYLSRVGAFLARIGFVRWALPVLIGGRPRTSRRMAAVFGPAVTSALTRLVGEVHKLPNDVHPLVQAHWCEPRFFHAMADYLRVLQREGARFGQLEPPTRVPLIVISGGHQSAAEIAAQRALAERSDHGRHVVAAHSGHWIPFDQPELIVSVVRELIAASPPIGRASRLRR